MADIFYQIANTHRNQEYFFLDVKEKHFLLMWPSYWERQVDKRVYKPLTRFTFNFVSILCETKEHLIQRGRCKNDLKLFRERRTIISRYAEQLVTWLNLTKSLFISSLGDSNTNGWLLHPLKTNFPFTK